MSKPRFKVGDAVRYKHGEDVMRVAYGPLEPVLYHFGSTAVFGPGEYCYIVDNGPTHRNVVSEDSLVHAEQWAPCPGTHRVGAPRGFTPGTQRYAGMERLLESNEQP